MTIEEQPAVRGPAEAQRRVIAVDLDRTLVHNDTLHEQIVRLVFGRPRLIGGLLAALMRGRPALKAFCADHVVLDPASLRASEEVLEFIRAERAAGSYIVLCSAADKRVAEAVARHLKLFDEVIATDGATNLKGRAKSRTLAERFPEGFIYAGDHAADLAVWKVAAGIVLVGVSPGVARRARKLGKPVLAEFRPQAGEARHPAHVWTRALRVHHWSKNVLMFVPLVLAHDWGDAAIVLRTIAGFLLLLALTSSSYLLNDLADIDADRAHATKRGRPVASGALPLAHAALVPAVAIPVALIAAGLLDPWFGVALASYLLITLAYSFGLKRIALLDVFIIAVLFTTRLVMGSAFVGTPLPIWLLTFSMFFFFSLAMAKRHAEIVGARSGGGAALKARGYEPEDWPLTLNLGVSSALGSLIILVLYLVDEAFKVVGYGRPAFLWLMVLCVAVWIGRIWLLTHRGRMHDDPVAFALRDRPSQAIAVLVGVCFLAAL
jgi:4-hydroxybenzoate polyprenyltransferase/phosphoserine phosphatase